MAETDDSFPRRNVVIPWIVAGLLLVAFGLYYFYEERKVEYPDDSVNVSVKKIELPARFDEVFKDFTGILLVDKDGKVTAITIKGAPINLCGSASRTECTLETTARALVHVASSASDIGTCMVKTAVKTCHKDGQYVDKWYWHRSPDHKRHFDCPDGCQ